MLQTDVLLDELNLRWEPCTAFASDGSGNVICADCGWLRDEHADAPAPTVPLEN
jgi:hypothetical protein